MTRRFEFADGTSNKFWEIFQNGAEVTICFGRIGTAGQTKTKSFSDEAAAKKHLDQLVAEKTKKGYREVEGASGTTVAAKGVTNPLEESPTFEGIFVVSKKLVLATKDEVDHLERTIRIPLPVGYREYVEKLGQGEFSENLRVWLPRTILEQYKDTRQMHAENFEEFYLQDEEEQPIRLSDVKKSVELAATPNGDSIVICPRFPGNMFVLPRNSSEVKVIQSGFADPRTVVKTCFAGQWEPTFEFFEPNTPQRKCVTFAYDTLASTEAIANLFEKRFSQGRTFRDQIGDGPGSYLRLFVEALGARVNISREPPNNNLTLYVNLDVDQESELQVFLADACEVLAMSKVAPAG